MKTMTSLVEQYQTIGKGCKEYLHQPCYANKCGEIHEGILFLCDTCKGKQQGFALACQSIMRKLEAMMIPKITKFPPYKEAKAVVDLARQEGQE